MILILINGEKIMASQQNRGKLRFTPESNQLSSISLSLAHFQKEISTLIVNESSSGACLVVNRKLIPSTESLIEGRCILVKIGKLDPLSAVVKWVKHVDDDFIKIGVEYDL